MQTLLKQSIIGGVSFLLLTGIAFSVGSSEPSVFEGEALAESFETKEFSFVKSDFSLGTSTSNTAFTVTKNHSTSTFTYTGTTNQTSGTDPANLWFNLKASSTAGNRFVQANSSGSSTNKWRATKFVFQYSKQTGTVGQTNEVTISTNSGTKNLFSYVSTTNSTSLINLNNNSATATISFTYEDNIQTFTIIPSYILYITSLTIEYTIDYSGC
jgi:hypothetical protein